MITESIPTPVDVLHNLRVAEVAFANANDGAAAAALCEAVDYHRSQADVVLRNARSTGRGGWAVGWMARENYTYKYDAVVTLWDDVEVFASRDAAERAARDIAADGGAVVAVWRVDVAVIMYPEDGE